MILHQPALPTFFTTRGFGCRALTRVVYIYLPPILIALLYVHVDDYFRFIDKVEWKIDSFRDFGKKWKCIDKGPVTSVPGIQWSTSASAVFEHGVFIKRGSARGCWNGMRW